MGIPEGQFATIWQAILCWMRQRGFSSDYLAYEVRGYNVNGYSQDHIESGIKGGTEWLTSDFVHACVDIVGLTNARQRGPEDTNDILTDEECVELLTSPLKGTGGQGGFWA